MLLIIIMTSTQTHCAYTTLTHWGQVTHICVSNIIIIGSENGLSPFRCQAIIWTNGGILLIRRSGTYLSEMVIKSHTFSFKKMHLKMSSGKWRPSCLCLKVLNNGKCIETVPYDVDICHLILIHAIAKIHLFCSQLTSQSVCQSISIRLSASYLSMDPCIYFYVWCTLLCRSTKTQMHRCWCRSRTVFAGTWVMDSHGVMPYLTATQQAKATVAIVLILNSCKTT